ncbi:MAG: hypothetical protein NC117_02050 [Pseudoflavonifractor sp.]|nr:hypothetical protein [Pseudoflavonifractor sp.]
MERLCKILILLLMPILASCGDDEPQLESFNWDGRECVSTGDEVHQSYVNTGAGDIRCSYLTFTVYRLLTWQTPDTYSWTHELMITGYNHSTGGHLVIPETIVTVDAYDTEFRKNHPDDSSSPVPVLKIFAIRSDVFNNGGAIESLSLPSTVGLIHGDAAFLDNCPRLTDIYCHSPRPIDVESRRIGVDYDNVTLHVPAGTRADWSATTPWRHFLHIIDDL